MAYYVPPSKKVGRTRSPCPPPNCAHGWEDGGGSLCSIFWRHRFDLWYFIEIQSWCLFDGH